MTQSSEDFTTNKRVEQYSTIRPMLSSAVIEFKEFSKKDPKGIINKRKLSLVNGILQDAMKLLENEPTIKYLSLLDEDDMPSNSDVSLLLGQFVAAMSAFRDRYYQAENIGLGGEWRIE